VLSGGGSQLGGLARRLAMTTGIPVEPAAPLAPMQIGKTGLSEAQLDYVQAFSVVPVGLAMAGAAWGDDWPQWLGPQRDGVWRETGILEKLPSDGPPIRWRTPIAAGYAGPAVADGRVYVTHHIVAPGATKPASP